MALVSGMYRLRDRSRNRRSRGRYVIGLTSALLTVTALYTSALIIERQKALEEVSRYNVTWLATQAAFEVSRLETEIAKSGLPESPDKNAENIGLWLDIVANRVQILQGSEFQAFVEGRPELASAVVQLSTALTRARPLVRSLNQPGTAEELLALFAPLNFRLAKVASVAYAMSSELASRDIGQLGHLYWIFSGILSGLVGCSLALVVTLKRQNKLLQHAHEGLQQTTEDLGIANSQVRVALEELRVQHEVLHLRDQELRTQNGRFNAALENMPHGICMADANGRIVVCNSRFAEMFGLLPESIHAGATVRRIFKEISVKSQYERDLLLAVRRQQQLLVAERRSGTFFREDRTGQALSIAHCPTPDGGWVAIYEDITERRRADAQVHFMAHHDALTGLPNRLHFRQALERAAERYNRTRRRFAVLLLDLDHFKNVNDTQGHLAGDALLQEVALRLQKCIRQEDTAARFGGDEFAVLQSSLDSTEDAAVLAQRIIAAFEAPFDLEGHRAAIGVSIGIALGSDERTGADLLLKTADMALYGAKADGRGCYRFFEARMDEELRAKLALESDLRDALALGEIEVYYQPIVSLQSSRLRGFEALARWRHKERGHISPSEFIPVAEDIGLISQLGEAVMRRACLEAAGWPDDIQIAVNISPVQFRSGNIVETVLNSLRFSGLAPHRLEIEITESTLLQNNSSVAATLYRLRKLGVSIALDDFGTGYSSLSYLRNFPFSKIKIDRSFVGEMAHDPNCQAIVRSVVTLARDLNMSTTAEGVATPDLLQRVTAAGCTDAQGFFLGAPEDYLSTCRRFDGGEPRDGQAGPAVTSAYAV